MTSTKAEPINLRFARITPKWAQQQLARRVLVVLMYTLPLFSLIVHLVFSNTLFTGIVIALAIASTLLCWAWVVGASGAISDLPDEYLDERQRSRRDHSYRLSYIYFAGGMAIFAIYLFFAADASKLNLPMPQKADAIWWFWLVLYPALSLPSAVYAWAEPDLVFSEENQ
jgi:hypothetical protein